jgi:hypothetical protein
MARFVRSTEGLPCTFGRYTVYTEIDYVDRRKQVPLAVAIDQVSFTLAAGKELSLTFTTGECDFFSAVRQFHRRNFSIRFPSLKSSFREIFAIFGAINIPPHPTFPELGEKFRQVMRGGLFQIRTVEGKAIKAAGADAD